MSDFLLDLSPQARRIIKSLGLPIPLPTPLERTEGPWAETPLFDRSVVVGTAGKSELLPLLADVLARAGADTFVVDDRQVAAFAAAGEAFGRPARPLTALGEERMHALLFDATALRAPEELGALYTFFHPLVGRLARSGRVVVIGRPPAAAASGPEAAARAALEGFVRSVAKEIGRGGATANLVLVDEGAESRLAGPLRFLLSSRSAFVSAQPLHVDGRAAGGAEPTWVRPLERRTALVTGAARGIGAATARRLAAEGAHVLCLDRPEDDGALSQLAREIEGTPLGVDITAESATVAVLDAVRRRGGVDVVVHNAGITRDKTLGRMEQRHWDQVLAVNLEAILRLTDALDPALNGGGRIVCLSSVSGIAGNVGQTNYAASKAALVGWVATEAQRLAGRGITVNAIAPGFIETRLTAAIPVAIREVARRLSALGQGGLPEDVAEAIVFLASPGAQGITGRTLRVCGGAFVGA